MRGLAWKGPLLAAMLGSTLGPASAREAAPPIGFDCDRCMRKEGRSCREAAAVPAAGVISSARYLRGEFNSCELDTGCAGDEIYRATIAYVLPNGRRVKTRIVYTGAGSVPGARFDGIYLVKGQRYLVSDL